MSDEALETLRQEFADIDKSALELREEAREAAPELADHGDEPQRISAKSEAPEQLTTTTTTLR